MRGPGNASRGVQKVREGKGKKPVKYALANWSPLWENGGNLTEEVWKIIQSLHLRNIPHKGQES